jgi:hypothetical protein
MTGFFSFFLPVYKNGFNNSKYSLCLACCFSLALYNFLSKSLTVFLGVFLGVFNGSISWQLSNAPKKNNKLSTMNILSC